jgi:hypothetical protein
VPAILNVGKTAIRDVVKGLVTHVGLASDTTAFDATQTRLNPSSGGTVLIKASTETNVDAATFDAAISINGDTEFTNASIGTIGLMSGSAATNALTRSVRSQPIGVQTGDVFDVGVRCVIEDNTP